MWLKILGVVCVGVFVGAAIVEARQLCKRGKEAGEEAGEGDEDGNQTTALGAGADADLAHEER